MCWTQTVKEGTVTGRRPHHATNGTNAARMVITLQEIVAQESLEVPNAKTHGQTQTATDGDGDSLTRGVGTGTAFMNSTTRSGNKLMTSGAGDDGARGDGSRNARWRKEGV